MPVITCFSRNNRPFRLYFRQIICPVVVKCTQLQSVSRFCMLAS
jgi:hypothetical protein